ncbi:hypothetical protein TIFTF001_044191 [Ficus carica]|uniref:Transmembrane protein n=1 Tax=Ficus carica TaxID=3494 RepID=A0AA87ZK94_FICCA|nr:hypothetical protein TIFTF001_044191 [Ficus carica]
MAHVSMISKAFLVVVAAVFAVFLSASDVLAQDIVTAPSPLLNMDAGAGFSLQVSIVVFVSSFVVSLVALS